MRELSTDETDLTNGGNALAVLAAVILVGNAIDIAYNAGKAFAEGYESNDKIG